MFLRVLEFLKKFFHKERENEIYYINGATTLPEPLEAEKEAKVLSLLICDNESQREEARNTLVEHNLRLVVYIAKKFENTGIGTEDLISIGTIGLIKAVSTFKPDKNIKIATYASKCIENEILMYIRKTSTQKLEVSFDEPLSCDWDGNELLLSEVLGGEGNEVDERLEEEEERHMIRRAVNRLNERDRIIISKRFGLCGMKEMTQKELADSMGISQSYISRLEKKIIKELKKDIIRENGMY